MAFIDRIKLSLRISNTDFDDEITMLINGAKQYLKSSGVNDETVDDSVAEPVGTNADPRVEQLITIYCKTLFGFDYKNNQNFQFPIPYQLILDQLRIEENYGESAS